MTYSSQRVPNITYVMNTTPSLTPPYIACPNFLYFCPTPLSRRTKPSPPLLFLMSFFFDWMDHCATFNVLFYLMILWIYTCQALVPKYKDDIAMCFMQQRIRFTEVWNIMWLFLVLWFDFITTYTYKDIQHTQGPIDWHAHINIYQHQLTCAHSNYLYYTDSCCEHNKTRFNKTRFFLFNKTRFFLWNTNNTDKNGVNK